MHACRGSSVGCAGSCPLRLPRHRCVQPQNLLTSLVALRCPQVATKLYSLPLFQPLRAPLAASLLAMLVGGLYRGAQDELVDSLFSLAAANWSDFHLVLLPQFVDQRLGRVGGAERASLVALFGHSDLEAHAFEEHLRRFLNDASYFERAAAA